MRKKFKVLFICMFVLLGMVGCSAKVGKSMSFTYSVDTGDKVKLTLDTSDNYKLTSELPFSILKDEETLSQGKFITEESYSQLVDTVKSDEKATLIDSGNKEGNEYIFWSYNESEYNYAVLISDSETGVIIGNPVSEESAKECFEKIDISKVE
ncbi:hypothetical protein E5347_16565 [Clostridium sartagoforme]|uniref:Lipoprotein n=1 Tax=Clostridium sartagoforme TaxID=84031 RepID=A0A4S2DDH8_9CLOT|nr:hypothetical protein [Clostridium sartagoforme]TGY38961.1 hypothetical protein E5347_16565 [Clostridium sartagoforme]